LASAAIAWARAFGEFGPVLVFAGSFRGRTEVLPVSIYLELNSGNLAGAAAISILMIVIAGIVFLSVRLALSDRGQS
jgi:molybdate transport system permease protein